jgi:hypothetical protein
MSPHTPHITRVLIHDDPFFPLNQDKLWRERGYWPASWIACPDAAPPFVAAFRLKFKVDAPATLRLHISADERYELFVDGARVGRGPERGAPDCWFFETYDAHVDAGEHVIVARQWAWGPHAPLAQMSATPGFLLAAEGEWTERLSTGLAAWEVLRIDAYSFMQFERISWKGGNTVIDGARYPFGVARGEGEGWQPAITLRQAMAKRIDWELPPNQQVLQPAMLPAMLFEQRDGGNVRFAAAVSDLNQRDNPIKQSTHDAAMAAQWQALLRSKGAVTLQPHQTQRIVIDLENYFCLYTQLRASGAGVVQTKWVESLFRDGNMWHGDKGHRDAIDGKFVIGNGDVFKVSNDAPQEFMPLWWSAGRYVEICAQAGDAPLTLHALHFHETRYPLRMESAFASSDDNLNDILPMLVRGIEASANETYFDAPHWEELMYLGDTRLESLCTHIMTRDSRLPRKAVRMFDVSRVGAGLTQSRFPSRQMQLIPPFSLWWVCMARDFALWRGDEAYLRETLPGVRAVIEGYLKHIGDDGLMHAWEGWNFLDWVPAWSADAGTPPDGVAGISGGLNWQLVYALSSAIHLEEMAGEHALAQRLRRIQTQLAQRITETFWDEARGLMADDRAHQHFSEHAQCLAILSGQVDERRRERMAGGLLTAPDLYRATIYFSHYLFETFRELGRMDVFLQRLQLWHDLKANGLKTPVEMPEPTRSDCHGWGSHPLYHCFASLLGVRPVSMGFRSVEIRPQLGTLQGAKATLVHPLGEIVIDVQQRAGETHGHVALPEGVAGVLIANGRRREFAGSLRW